MTAGAVVRPRTGTHRLALPTSACLKRKRDKLHRCLTADFDSQKVKWIEAGIEHLDRNIEREEIDEER